MQIVFDNYIHIYLFAYVALPMLVFYKFKHLRNSYFDDEHVLSLEFTNLLKGIFVILVVLAHTTQRMPDILYLFPLRISGNFTNTIFLFLSGYGIMYSFLNKENYLKGFVFKRLIRVYTPFVLTNIIAITTYNIMFGNDIAFADFIIMTIQIKGVLGSFLWFVIAILLFYSSFYLSFKFFPENLAIKSIFIFSMIYIGVCIYLNLGIWWYNTAFCFPLGVYFCSKRKVLIKKIKERYWQLLLICGIGSFFTVFSFTHYISLTYLAKFTLFFNIAFTVFFIILIILLAMKVNLKSGILEFVGKISYEVYLIHMMLLALYFKIVTIKESYSFYLFFALTIILSIVLNKFVNLIFGNINRLIKIRGAD